MFVPAPIADAARVAAATVALCVGLGLARGAAQPGEPSSTVVVLRSVDLSDERREAIFAALENRLRAIGRIPVHVAEPQPPPSLGPALAQAIDAYHQLRPADAIAGLDAVATSFESAGLGLERDELVQLFLVRALAAIAQGRAEEVDAAVDRALQIDPRLRPDPESMPPSLARRVERRRASLHDAQLTLGLDAPLDRLVIDGLAVGTSGRVVMLTSGRHVVRAESAGRRPVTLVLDLPPGPSSVGIDFEDDGDAYLTATILPGVSDTALVSAAERIDASVLAVDITVDGARMAVRVFDGVHERRASLDVDSDAELVARAALGERLVDTSLAAAPEVATAPSTLLSATNDHGARRRRRILLPTGVGVAVASLTAVLVALSLRSDGIYTGSFERVAR